MVRVRRAECDLELVEPTEADEVRVLDYKREHFACGETVLNGGSLLGRMDSYPAWLARLRSNRSRETVPRDWVVADTLLAVRRRDGRMVGIVDIRYELNDFLRQSAGHIGYGVRPSERRKGYATGILHLALIRAAERGLDAVLVACRPENSGSRRLLLSYTKKLYRFCFLVSIHDNFLSRVIISPARSIHDNVLQKAFLL